jgi:hypothetical protein
MNANIGEDRTGENLSSPQSKVDLGAGIPDGTSDSFFDLKGNRNGL